LASLVLLACPAVFGATYSGTGGSIPDGTVFVSTPGVFTSDIVVPDIFLISDVTVRLFGLTHGFVGDLRVSLTNVGTGTEVFLFRQVGQNAVTHSCAGNPIPGASCTSDLSGTYAFNDAFAGDFWAASGTSPLPPGNYFPTGGNGVATSLNAGFAGLLSSGTWRLTIGDYEPQDVGNLGSWELELTGSGVPEPSTAWLLVSAAAALGFYRRRR